MLNKYQKGASRDPFITHRTQLLAELLAGVREGAVRAHGESAQSQNQESVTKETAKRKEL